MLKIIKILAGIVAVLAIGAYVLYQKATTPPSRVDNPIVTGVNYIGMTVSDLDQSTAFYNDFANLEKTHSSLITHDNVIDTIVGREGVQATTHLMTSVNAQLKFMQFENPSQEALQADFVGANGPGIAHVCFQVNHKTDSYGKFLAGGGTHIGDREITHLNPKNPVYYAYARDLDNTMVEIEHVDVEKLNLPTPPKNNYRIRHVSLATTDMDRAVDFYSVLLETTAPRRAGQLIKLKGAALDKVAGFPNSELEMAWFQIRNIELELIQYFNPAVEPLKQPRPMDATGYNMIMFNVTDLDKAKEKLLAAGGTLEADTHDRDGGKVFFGRDLDGNLLGFQVITPDSPYSAKNFKNNGMG